MKLGTFNTFEQAQIDAFLYVQNARQHSGFWGKEYRIYYHNGKYILFSGWNYNDFPENLGRILFSTRVTPLVR